MTAPRPAVGSSPTPGPVKFTNVRDVNGHAGGVDRRMRVTLEVSGTADTIAQVVALVSAAPELLDCLRCELDAIDAGELLTRWSDDYVRENGLTAPESNQDRARALLARIGGGK